eukprot:363925-Chlamydomonas_euryale.AAC.23
MSAVVADGVESRTIRSGRAESAFASHKKGGILFRLRGLPQRRPLAVPRGPAANLGAIPTAWLAVTQAAAPRHRRKTPAAAVPGTNVVVAACASASAAVLTAVACCPSPPTQPQDEARALPPRPAVRDAPTTTLSSPSRFRSPATRGSTAQATHAGALTRTS